MQTSAFLISSHLAFSQKHSHVLSHVARFPCLCLLTVIACIHTHAYTHKRTLNSQDMHMHTRFYLEGWLKLYDPRWRITHLYHSASQKHPAQDNAFHNPLSNCFSSPPCLDMELPVSLVLSSHHNYACLTHHSTLLWIYLCPLNAPSFS